MNKVKCPVCGKTVAVETEKTVEIQCSGKNEGHKCKNIVVIKKEQ